MKTISAILFGLVTCIGLSSFASKINYLTPASLLATPITNDDLYTTPQDMPLTIPYQSGVLANDYDPDGNPIYTPATTRVSSLDTNKLIMNNDGSFTYIPAPGFFGQDSFEYLACDAFFNCACAVAYFNVGTGGDFPIVVQLFVLLEGAFDGNESMNTFLNRNTSGNVLYRGLLPGQRKSSGDPPTPPFQPYNTMPWNYNGTEGQIDMPPYYYAPGSPNGDPDYAIYHPDVVDWVLVRFWTGSLLPYNTRLEMSAAALLLKTGKVVFFNDFQLKQSYLSSDIVFVQIDHRNHMAVLSSGTNINNGLLIHDFRNGNSFSLPDCNGQNEIPGLVGNRWVMFSGDADQTSDLVRYDINAMDKYGWSMQNGIFNNYTTGDWNMDGNVDGADRPFWTRNNGMVNCIFK